jgi:predicted HAD superfamily Cof-like phosphohydrolase
MKTIDMVREFHSLFCPEQTQKRPCLPDAKTLELRIKLIRDELEELEAAFANSDLINAAQELADLQYVVDGTFLALGLGEIKERLVAEIHRSNMTKLGPDGMPVRREDGKVLKGPEYEYPNHGLIVRMYQALMRKD